MPARASDVPSGRPSSCHYNSESYHLDELRTPEFEALRERTDEPSDSDSYSAVLAYSGLSASGEIYIKGDLAFPALGLNAIGDELAINGDCVSANLLILIDWNPILAPTSTSSMTVENSREAQSSGEAILFTRVNNGKQLRISISGAEKHGELGGSDFVWFLGELHIVCEALNISDS